jgi:hypothetical protein
MLFLNFSSVLLLFVCIVLILCIFTNKTDNNPLVNDDILVQVAPDKVDGFVKNRELYETAIQNSTMWQNSTFENPMQLSWDDTIRLRKWLKNDRFIIYLNDIYNHYLSIPPNERHSIIVKIGDHSDVYPEETTYLSKSRVIGDENVILQRWNVHRHWRDFSIVHFIDIPWRRKSPKIVWRGVSTGDGERMRFAEKYATHPNRAIDVGITNFVQGEKTNKKILKRYYSITKQLRNRYIVCIEGNDVATGLKWVLASNSLCFMKRPKRESWFRESRLLPGVHFVELNDDFSNLEEQYSWALTHEKECLQIVKNANQYTQQFRNSKYQEELSKKVFRDYVRKRHEQIQK